MISIALVLDFGTEFQRWITFSVHASSVFHVWSMRIHAAMLLEMKFGNHCKLILHAWWLVARRVFVCFQNNTLYSWWILYRVCLCAVLLLPIDYNHVAAKHHARFMRHSKLGWIAVLAQFQIHLMQSFAELHNIVKQTPRTALIQNNSYEN